MISPSLGTTRIGSLAAHISLILLMLLSISACSNGSLSRSEAAKLIKASGQFDQVRYWDVATRAGTAPSWGWNPQTCSQYDDKPGWQPLIALGYATVQITKDTLCPFCDPFFSCSLQLTSAGQGESNQWRFSQNTWSIPVGTKQFVDITGIVQNTGAVDAQVQYTWRWNLNAFGRGLGALGNGIQSGSGVCRRYDDGWRLESIQ